MHLSIDASKKNIDLWLDTKERVALLKELQSKKDLLSDLHTWATTISLAKKLSEELSDPKSTQQNILQRLTAMRGAWKESLFWSESPIDATAKLWEKIRDQKTISKKIGSITYSFNNLYDTFFLENFSEAKNKFVGIDLEKAMQEAIIAIYPEYKQYIKLDKLINFAEENIDTKIKKAIIQLEKFLEEDTAPRSLMDDKLAAIKLREGAPIGSKNPAQTCWLNAALVVLFGGDSLLARTLLALDRNTILDPFTRSLYDYVKKMHDPEQKWLSYKNNQNIPGAFWQALKKVIKGLSFDETRDDIEAFSAILNQISTIIPGFDTTFGARAFGNIFNQTLSFDVFETFGTTSINAKTITEILSDANLAASQAQQLPAPKVFWIKCNAEPKTPIKLALGPDLNTILNTKSSRTYTPTGLTVYKIYQSVLASGKLSEEKIHYAGIIKSGKKWYLVDDATVTEILQKDLFIQLAQKGFLVTTHKGAGDAIFKTTWYPSILQYRLR